MLIIRNPRYWEEAHMEMQLPSYLGTLVSAAALASVYLWGFPIQLTTRYIRWYLARASFQNCPCPAIVTTHFSYG